MDLGPCQNQQAPNKTSFRKDVSWRCAWPLSIRFRLIFKHCDDPNTSVAQVINCSFGLREMREMKKILMLCYSFGFAGCGGSGRLTNLAPSLILIGGG
jgi:hypothetical protein